MTRTFTQIFIATLLGLALTTVAGILFSSQTEAYHEQATSLEEASSLSHLIDKVNPSLVNETIPLAIPQVASITNVTLEDSFVAPASPTIIDFDSATENAMGLQSADWTINGESWTGIGFRDSYGDIATENGQLVISHTVGKFIDRYYDTHYLFYREDAYPNFGQLDITVITVPTKVFQVSDTNQQGPAYAGVQLWSENPGDKPNSNPNYGGGDRLSFGFKLNDNNGSSHKLFFSYRINDNWPWATEADSITPDAFPVKLRITKAGDNYTFAYSSSLMSDYSVVGTRNFSYLGDSPYISLFGTNRDRYAARNFYTRLQVDDLILTPSNYPDGWSIRKYNPDVSYNTPYIDTNGHLILRSNGYKVDQFHDNQNGAYAPFEVTGYTLLYRNVTMDTKNTFEAIVQMLASPTIDGGAAGLELRTSISSGASNKIQLGIWREEGVYKLKALSRVDVPWYELPDVIEKTINPATSEFVDEFPDTPIWLRITRDPGSNTIHFYFLQRAGNTVPAPTEWLEMPLTLESDIEAALHPILFTSSGTDDVFETSKFDNFKASSEEIFIAGLDFTDTSPQPPNDTISFTASITQGTNVNYIWDFGDGTLGNGLETTHAYTQFGTFEVSLVAENNLGQMEITKTVVVTELPIIGLAIDVSEPVYYNLAVVFNAVIESGSNVQYQWSPRPGVVSSFSSNPQFIYTNYPETMGPVIYPVVLTATNGVYTATRTTFIQVDEEPDEQVTGLAVFNPSPVALGNTVLFTTSVVSGNKIRYTWDMGNGDILPEELGKDQVNYFYTEAGEYEVTVQARNNLFGEIATTNVVIYGYPQLEITKSGPEAVAFGEEITYTLTAWNTGNDIARNVIITDILPFRTDHVRGGTLDGDAVRWEFAEIPINSYVTTQLVIKPQQLGQVVNDQYYIWAMNRYTQTFTATGKIAVATYVDARPIAEAGPAQILGPTDPVSLDGSASYDPQNLNLTYEWKQVKGDTVRLNGANSPTPNFTAPEQVGELIFLLTVQSEHGIEATDFTTVTITADPYYIMEKKAPKIANPNESFNYTIVITNLGTAAGKQLVVTDVLPVNTHYIEGGTYDNGVVTWLVDNIDRNSQIQVTFAVTVPENSVDFVVNSEYQARSIDGSMVQGQRLVKTTINKRPQANAGDDQVILSRAPVILNGSQSSDPDGHQLTYQWQQLSGSSVSLSNANTAQATFTAPSQVGELQFELTVTDQYGLSQTDLVTVTIAPWTMVVADSGLMSCVESEAVLITRNILRVVDDNDTAFYIGYRQVDGQNRNPVIAKFTNGNQDWCKDDYDDTEADSMGYGVLWDGGIELYVVFSTNDWGRNGNNNALRRFSNNGWLTTYNDQADRVNLQKVAFIAKLSSDDGSVSNATFMTARSRNGTVNQLQLTSLLFEEGKQNLRFSANSWDAPRRPNHDAFFCGGREPYPYEATISTDLSSLVAASAVGCFETLAKPLTMTIVGPSFGVISETYQFNVQVEPDNAVALTYDWTPQPNGIEDAEMISYTWETTGVQRIDLFIENELGTLSSTHWITITDKMVAPTRAIIQGPKVGYTNQSYTFTTSLQPDDVTGPLTYNWSPEPENGQGYAMARYQWDTVATYTIAVTVSNSGGLVQDTHEIAITSATTVIPPTAVVINGSAQALLNTPYQLGASVSPLDVSTPLTYSWMPAPMVGQGTGMVTYTWQTTGTYAITVMVENTGGMVSNTIEVNVMEAGLMAASHVLTTRVNTAVTINPLQNTLNPNGGELTLVSMEPPSHGIARAISNTIIYTPTSDFTGTDSFTYTATNGNNEFDSALITVLVIEPETAVALRPITPTMLSTFTFIEDNRTTTIEIPVGAASEPFVLVRWPLSNTTHVNWPANHTPIHLFALQAYVEGRLQEITFTPPLTITITYQDEAITELNETTLHIRYWDETTQEWSTTGITSTPYPNENKVVARLSHFTEFAIFGEASNGIYLPIVVKQ